MAKYESLKDHVYEYIMRKIQSGKLLPNQKINEQEIYQALGISRTPTREALIQLSADNLIEYIPRKGFLVKNIDNKQKLDVYRIIGTLDALAAALSLNLLTEDDYQHMAETLEKIDISIKYNNYPDYCQLQTEFHDIYINKCNNPSLIKLLYSLKNSFIRLSYMSDNKERLFTVLKDVNKEHKQIAELFQSKDLHALETAIKAHWDTEPVNEDMI